MFGSRCSRVKITGKLIITLTPDKEREISQDELDTINEEIMDQLYDSNGFDEMELDEIYQDDEDVKAVYFTTQHRRFDSAPATRWEPGYFEVEDEITESDIQVDIKGYSLSCVEMRNVEYDAA